LAWTAVWDAIIMSETLFKLEAESWNKDPRVKHEDDIQGNDEAITSLPPWLEGGGTENREKVIILLTDWDANVWVDPKIASLDAKDKWIKIYTIWIWSETWWEMTYFNWPFQQIVQIPPLNWESLKEIAKTTSWEFFRATDNNSLENIFEYLEKLEKSDIEIETKKEFSTDYEKFAVVLIGLLFIYLVLVLWKVER
jgi:Ca-activated chloride channel family protein